ncbi:MAG: cytochrome c2 [Planctomycetota bacterium]|jgi:cytochrome c2
MADRGDTHYNVPNLNQWFFWSSLLLLISIVWTVIDDWNAEWKTYQRTYQTHLLAKAQEALTGLEEAGVVSNAEELAAAVEAANAALSSRRQELSDAETAAYEAKEERFRIEQIFKGKKGEDAWERLMKEDKILYEGHDPLEEAAAYEAMLVETFDFELDYQDQDKVYQDARRVVADIRSDVSAAEAALSAATRDLTRVNKVIDTYDPSDIAVQAANIVRDFPGLDFIGPDLIVSKQVLTNLTFELNFTKKTRIDMCTTCHQGIENEEMVDAPQPYTTHPRLDLFLTSKSPHALSDIGCTICHRGSGESLSFQHADHRPSDAEESAQWDEEHHWHKQHHWDYPMLDDSYTEAGCVQCHTNSMELIAEDAPRVTEGMHLFEEKGCYACHKVDWFPTKRKPGPTLKSLSTKLQQDFVESWIANPKGFRPRSNMPQVFHLENYPPDEVVVLSKFGKGEAIMGQEWNEAAVSSISHYLFAKDSPQTLEPMPVEGDANRGREVFRLAGCLACHNLEEHDGDELAIIDPAQEPNEYNTMGPNLRGVATKVTKDWLYHWIKDPTRYWKETRMPNLRLSDQDAADITAYMIEDPDGTFHDTPDGWEPKEEEVSIAVLQEQSRWFYGKLGRRELERRIAGETPEHRWDQEEPLKAAVGEAWVRHQGCFSCHLVSGMENDMPIGAELTNWGSKTVDKLDFGMTHLKEVAGLPKLDHHYREGWLERKLQRPRVYDIDKIKNPKEKLRMPFFDLTEDEAQAIATFVVGLVDDEVSRARMNPTPEKAAADMGMRVVRQKNCMACHVVDPAEITYRNDDNQLMTIQGQMLPLDGHTQPLQLTDLPQLEADLTAWAEEMDEDYPEDITIQLLGINPDVGVPGDKVFILPENLVAISPVKGGAFVGKITDYYYHGTEVPDPDDSSTGVPWTIGFDQNTNANLIEDNDGQQRAYANEPYDRIRWAFAPPVLWNEGHKLQREWFYSFLKDPSPIRPQLRVKMPTFQYAPGEAEAVADYFATKARKEWYQRFAKSARWSQGRTAMGALADASAHKWSPHQLTEWPTGVLTTEIGPGMSAEDFAAATGMKASTIRAIESGVEVDTIAKFSTLFDKARELGFGMVGIPSQSYEAVGRRQPTARAASAGAPAQGHRLAVGGEGAVDCFKCHQNGDAFPATPVSWAPSLENVRSRLREDWVYEWLWNPALVYPGTAMLANFQPHMPDWQAVYPDSTNAEQVEVVLQWLFNMDEIPAASN